MTKTTKKTKTKTKKPTRPSPSRRSERTLLKEILLELSRSRTPEPLPTVSSVALLIIEDSHTERAQLVILTEPGAKQHRVWELQSPNSATIRIQQLVGPPVFITEVGIGPCQIASGALLSVDIVPNGQWPDDLNGKRRRVNVAVERLTCIQTTVRNEVGFYLPVTNPGQSPK